MFFKSPAEFLETYPELNVTLDQMDVQALAFLPLIIGSECIGAISFNFRHHHPFSQADQDFFMAIANQCAQALHRSRLFDETREAVAVRDEFLSIASHELKTPLTPLKLQLQLLSRQMTRGEKEIPHAKLLKMTNNFDLQLKRLSKLIEDLLDVSRITTGKLSLNLEKFNLAEMIYDVMGQYGQQLKQAIVKVHISSNKDIEGMFDRMRLEQVLINLLINAAKYAPGKPIHVVLEKNNNLAVIRVTDQGPGIAPDDQERIFKRFERVKGSENIGGLGLGLYISSQIIKAHNGIIRVESEPGKGASFIIELPIIENQNVERNVSSA
jgi:signal transduction histidine kinase